MSEEDYLKELDKKSNEEVADILEVLYAICEAREYSMEQLMQMKAKKQEERGGFAEKIYWKGNETC